MAKRLLIGPCVHSGVSQSHPTRQQPHPTPHTAASTHFPVSPSRSLSVCLPLCLSPCLSLSVSPSLSPSLVSLSLSSSLSHTDGTPFVLRSITSQACDNLPPSEFLSITTTRQATSDYFIRLFVHEDRRCLFPFGLLLNPTDTQSDPSF